MFTRLRISLEGNQVIFEAHELVKLMQDISFTAEKTRVFIPKQGDFDHYRAIQIKPIAYCYLRGDYDTAIFMPMHIELMRNIGQYFFVADQLGKWAEHIHLQGWWLLFGGRSLFLKNPGVTATAQEKKKRFYIADFGTVSDIFDSVRRVVLERPWLEEAPELSLFKEAEISEKKKSKLIRLVINDLTPFDKIHDKYPSRTPEQLLSMCERIAVDDKYACQHFAGLQAELLYIEEKLKPRLIELLKEFSSQEILDKMPSNPSPYARTLKMLYRRLTGLEIMMDVNEGKREHFFRPLHAFGEPDSDGADYPKFAEQISQHLLKLPFASLASKELTMQLRSILKGEFEPPEELYFLPNLVAAWFVGEASRNISSIPVGLMLLDFLENPEWSKLTEKELRLSDGRTSTFYTWRNVFLHPNEPTETLCHDLYGSSINNGIKDRSNTDPIKYFRGTHPMVHKDSRPEAATTLSNGQRLSRVRQKEGHLILNWLFIHLIQGLTKKYTITLDLFDLSNPSSYLTSKPDYRDMEILLQALSNGGKSKKIKSDRRLSLKYALLEGYIIPLLKLRCSTLDNLTLVDLEHIGRRGLSVQKDKAALPKDKITPASTMPAVRVQPSPGFEFVLSSVEVSDLFSVVTRACSDASIKIDLTSSSLKHAVRSFLLENKEKYKKDVKKAFEIMMVAEIGSVDMWHVVGVAELIANPEKFFGSFLFFEEPRKNKIFTDLFGYAFTSAQEATLPVLPKITVELQEAMKNFKIYFLLRFADSIWYKKRLKFLHETLKVQGLTAPRYVQIYNRIIGLLDDAKEIDGLYEGLIEKEMNKLYELYSNNLLEPVTSVGNLEIGILAQLLKVNINIFTRENYTGKQQQILIKHPRGGIYSVYADIAVKHEEWTNEVTLVYLGDGNYATAKRLQPNMIIFASLTRADIPEDGFIISLLKKAGLLVNTRKINESVVKSFTVTLDDLSKINPLKQEAVKYCWKSRSLILTDYGITITDHGGNGDCLFRVIAAQVGVNKKMGTTGNIEIDHTLLREITVVALRSQIESIGHLLTGEELMTLDGIMKTQNFDDYLRFMALPGTWGGQIELFVLARLLERPVILLGANTRPQFFEEGSLGVPMFLYYTGDHYQAAIPRDGASRSTYTQILHDARLTDLPSQSVMSVGHGVHMLYNTNSAAPEIAVTIRAEELSQASLRQGK